MGAAAGSHTKKELLLVKRLQNRAKRVFNRGRTTWRASLTRPQSHRDHRNKTIFVPRKRGHGPEPSAGRSRAPPPAFRGHGSISQRPHPSGSKPQVPCPSCPGPGTSAALGKKSRSSREAPRLQDTRCPPAICRRHAPCNDLAAETHPSLLRCLTPSPSDCLTARGSAALARQRGTGRGRAASQGHAAPWAWAMERHGWSRAPFHLHPTLRGLVRLL